MLNSIYTLNNKPTQTKFNTSSCIKAWRNHTDRKILRIKGHEHRDKNKLKLFEQAIDYILTTKSSGNELVKEVLGFNNTNSKAFYELSIDNSIFFYNDITKPIAYLICFCFLKECYSNNSNFNDHITSLTITNWLKKILGNNIFFTIDQSDVKEVQIIDSCICFHGSIYKNLSPVKLNRLLKYQNSVTPLYTKKLDKLNLVDKTYTNHDGKCKGATIYWLEQQSLAYEESGVNRQKIKNLFIKSLKISSYQDTKFICNYEITKLINKYQNNNWNHNKFKHLQNLYYLNSNITLMINNLLEIMQINNLDKCYVLMLTYEHAMGISLIDKGGRIKLNYYDPNNNLLHWSIYINKDGGYIPDCNLLIKNMPYLQEKSNSDLLIRIECYTTEILSNEYQSIKNTLPYITSLDYLQQQLILGINLNDEVLVNKPLEAGIDPNFICNGRFPLIIAVDNLNKHIINLLIKYNAMVNYETDDGLTPLIVAILKKDIQIITLLLHAGASVNYPAPLKPLSFTNNEKIIFLLKTWRTVTN